MIPPKFVGKKIAPQEDISEAKVQKKGKDTLFIIGGVSLILIAIVIMYLSRRKGKK